MKRREFLTRAGVGAAALGTVPLLAGQASADDDVGGGMRYHFVVLSVVAGAPDRLLIQGDGPFSASTVGGGGLFDHFLAQGSPPLPLVATGRWKARKVVSWVPLGTHGVFQAGTLTVLADFLPVGGAPDRGVEIEIFCNLGPAGASTGEEEGVVVTVPGAPPVVFKQASPTVGVTIFSNRPNPRPEG